jgi:hypothetical protein
VLALWRDGFDYSKRPAVSYRLRRSGAKMPDWMELPGNRTRLGDLQWTREHCDGCFRIVITEATDPAVGPRVIAGASPHRQMVMKITKLDEEAGEFTAAAERIVLSPRPTATGDLPTKVQSALTAPARRINGQDGGRAYSAACRRRVTFAKRS